MLATLPLLNSVFVILFSENRIWIMLNIVACAMNYFGKCSMYTQKNVHFNDWDRV